MRTRLRTPLIDQRDAQSLQRLQKTTKNPPKNTILTTNPTPRLVSFGPFLGLVLGLFFEIALGLWWTPSHAFAQDDWKIKRTDRWETIADRLEAMYLARPSEGYALNKLIRHYKGRGGSRTIRKRIQAKRKQQPNNAKLHLAIAILDLRTARWNRAYNAFKRLLSRSKPPIARDQLQLYLGRIALKLNRLPEAETFFQNALKKTKSNPLPLLKKLANITESMRKWEESIGYYQRWIKRRPRQLAPRLSLVRVLKLTKKHDQALTQLKAAARLAPLTKRPVMWKKIAQSYLAQKNFDQARKALSQARRRLHPTHWMHRELNPLEIEIYRQEGKLSTLIQRYQTKAKRNPRLYLPTIAKLQQELGQSAEALETYRTLFRKYPRHPAFLEQVKLLHNTQRSDQAIDLLEQRLKRTPRKQNIALQLLRLLHQTKQTESRNERIHTYLQIHRRNKLALGKLLTQSESWKLPSELQLKIFRQQCELQPHTPSCYRKWGAYLWNQKRNIAAWSIWNKIRNRASSNNPSDLLEYADLCRQYKRPKEGIAILRALLKKYPNHTRARLMLAETLLRQKQNPQVTIQAFQELLNRTQSSKIRRKASEGLLRATQNTYGYNTTFLIFRRNYLLEPFKKNPRKLLLTFYLQNHQRILARPLLRDSLKLFPKDSGFRRIALRIYQQESPALPHLRWLMKEGQKFDPTSLKTLVSLSHKHRQRNELYTFLQQLTQRWPNHAPIWGQLGYEALHQKQMKEAQRAFQQALQLAPKRTDYRLGLARLRAAESSWKESYRLLTQGPFPTKEDERRTWIQTLTHAAYQTNQSIQRTWTSLAPHLPNQERWFFAIIRELQSPKSPIPSKQRDNECKHLLQQGVTQLQQLIRSHPDSNLRIQAMQLLWRGNPNQAIFTFHQTIRDKNPLVRANAVLLLALKRTPQNYLIFEQLERSDSDARVRSAASMAAESLAKTYESWTMWRLLRWPGLWRSLLLLFEAQPNLRYLPLLERMYTRGSFRLSRPELLASIIHFPSAVIDQLERWIQIRQHACFAHHSLLFLKSPKHNNDALRKAAAHIQYSLRRIQAICKTSRILRRHRPPRHRPPRRYIRTRRLHPTRPYRRIRPIPRNTQP